MFEELELAYKTIDEWLSEVDLANLDDDEAQELLDLFSEVRKVFAAAATRIRAGCEWDKAFLELYIASATLKKLLSKLAGFSVGGSTDNELMESLATIDRGTGSPFAGGSSG